MILDSSPKVVSISRSDNLVYQMVMYYEPQSFSIILKQ